MFNHVLLEVYCFKNHDENASTPPPEFCTSPEDYEPGYRCLEKKCPFVAFTSCENTLCYINEKSEMEHGILFGIDEAPADIERWKQMSVEAVERTYEEFMKEKESA